MFNQDKCVQRVVAAALVLAGACALGPATAAPLFSSPPGGTLGGVQADDSAGSFTNNLVSAAGTLDAIVWWGFHGANSQGPAFDSFEVRLDGALRSGSLSSTAVGSNGLLRYLLDVADFNLAAGGHTLTLVNASPDVEWFWQDGSPTSGSQAFELLAAEPPTGVPEPASLALALLAGLGAVAASRRTRVG
ncbi:MULTISPECIES: PEP-CTERM domain protein [Aquincola]|uniref:PEP-CTERM domain protein n=1 Tax=Aquincola TaxID=391952 RepID=UPI000614F1CE|nr:MULTISPECIES: PEP-CTERM domain protein [Aquincola]MCR5864835.1 PEP-CTERM domain protein [Aquincola sp. J276]